MKSCHRKLTLNFYSPAPPPGILCFLMAVSKPHAMLLASVSFLAWCIVSLHKFWAKANTYSLVLFLVRYFNTAVRNETYVPPLKCLDQFDTWIIYTVSFLFVCFYFDVWDMFSCNSGRPQTPYVATSELEFLNLLPLPLTFWG